MSQPRTKDYARKEQQNIRGTLQSQNQQRFVEDIDEEYAGNVMMRAEVSGVNNNQSPQVREIGLS